MQSLIQEQKLPTNLGKSLGLETRKPSGLSIAFALFEHWIHSFLCDAEIITT